MLIHGLSDPDLVEVAARVLKKLGAVESVPALIQALQREELRETQRHLVISALGALGEPGAIPPLLERLASASPQESVSIARALGELKAAPAIPALITLLASDDTNVRDAALGGLEAVTGERLGRSGDAWRAWAEARVPELQGDNSRQRRPLNQRSTIGAGNQP